MKERTGEINFTKMHSCGNDYIYINCFEHEIASPETLAIKLSDRHFSVGGDGIILIMRSELADAKMRIFNIDGSEGKMCGNGIRCVAKYLYDNGLVEKTDMTIETLSGVRKLHLTVENGLMSVAKVDMGPAELRPELIPVNLPGESIVDMQVEIGGGIYPITCVCMGNPHAVVFCKNVSELPLSEIGPRFERDSLFPERVNAEFVEVISEKHLKMRVWERGSGITLGCGSGACAAAVAAVLNGYCKKGEDIKVSVPGGEVIVNYTDEAVYLTGDSIKAFDGTVGI